MKFALDNFKLKRGVVLSVLSIVCGILLSTHSLTAESVNSVQTFVFSEKSIKSTMNKQMFELSISVYKTEFNTQKNIPVKAKIKNLSDTSIKIRDLSYLTFYLSKHDKNEREKAIEGEIYIGLFSLTKRSPPNDVPQINPNEEYEFEVDLKSLGWDDWLSSFRTRDAIGKVPGGNYQLFMELLTVDEEKTTKEVKRFHSFTSNQINVVLKN